MLLQIHGYLLLSRLQRVTIPVYKTFVRNGISSVQYVIPCQNSDETSSVSSVFIEKTLPHVKSRTSGSFMPSTGLSRFVGY